MLRYLFLVCALCEAVFSNEGNQNGFVQPLDFGAIFGAGNSGISSLTSKPVRNAMLTVDKSQYPQLFDTLVSSSIDSIQRRVAPRDNPFSADHFGFNPIASQGFHPPAPVKSARLVRPPQHVQQYPVNYKPLPAQLQSYPVQSQSRPVQLQSQPSPLRYDIQTVHDADYKVYNPEEEERNEENILASLKKNPTVASYFQPATTNLEVAHPIKYRKEEVEDSSEYENNYKSKPYIAGSRIRRYTVHRKKEKDDSEEDEEDPYHYKAEYVARPKAFDGHSYSAYKEPKESKKDKDYDYPYDYDSGYDHKEYERIKELSEKQAAEIKQNPGNCKETKKDGMTCAVCKDPKTGGNYESCSYVTEPKNNKYAYSREKKFDSKDQPAEEPQNDKEDEKPKKIVKYEESSDEDEPPPAPSKYEKTSQSDSHETRSYNDDKEEDDGNKYNKGYYVHSSKPKSSEALRANNDDESSEEAPEAKSYDYQKAIPEFYTDNEPKKDVEHVLAEFKKKDRSACNKVQKNGMTCFQCIDKNGLKHEECMFVSESAPKRSHLAYQEHKEFTSKPPTLPVRGNHAAESQIVTTSSPLVQKSAAYIVANPGYGKKIKRKKSAQIAVPVLTVPNNPLALAPAVRTKRSEDDDGESRAKIVDETNVAPPEEFAGDNSKGAFWAETMPRYSPSLGVTLPDYMLTTSEHEAAFDETVAGA